MCRKSEKKNAIFVIRANNTGSISKLSGHSRRKYTGVTTNITDWGF